MSEDWKIVLTSGITIVGGLFIYVVGRFMESLWVEPIKGLRSLIGDIADSLIFYANIYSDSGAENHDIKLKCQEVLRRQASQLNAKASSISWYKLWAIIKIVPQKSNIREASSELIGLSNNAVMGKDGMTPKDLNNSRKNIEILLSIIEKPKKLKLKL